MLFHGESATAHPRQTSETDRSYVPAFSFSFSNRGRQYTRNTCTFPTLALLDGRPASQSPSPSPQPQTGVPFDGPASRSRTCAGAGAAAESEATGGPARKPTVSESEGQAGKHPLRHRCERGRLAGNRMLAPPARHHRTAEARREASREGIGSTPPAASFCSSDCSSWSARDTVVSSMCGRRWVGG